MRSQAEQLYNKVYELTHLDDTGGMVCVDDFTRLNKEIYELMNVLWDKRGKTVGEEAQICLSLLMGFSVCMYADEAHGRKCNTVIKRTERVLAKLDASELKKQLLAFYNK